MKSVFFVIVFISFAITFSQPEKADLKFTPFLILVPMDMNQNQLYSDLKINLVPDQNKERYQVSVNKNLRHKLANKIFNFNFKNCVVKKRPSVSISCKNTEISPQPNTIYSVSATPMLAMGNDLVEYYIIELSITNNTGGFSQVKYFTGANNIDYSNTALNIKVSQKK